MSRPYGTYLLILGFFALVFSVLPLSPGFAQPGTGDSLRNVTISANRPSVSARFVPDSIGIGDRFTLEVEIEKDIIQPLAFPEFRNNMLGEVIEIVSEGDADTIARDGRRVTLSKRYVLQTFEDGYFSMGLYPMLYGDKNIVDTVWSVDSLKLFVGTFEIDTLTQTIYDIKPVLNLPLKLGEVSGYGLAALVGLLLLAFLVWYLVSRRRNVSLLGKPKPVEPPHLKAIKALESLHNQKLWQNNKHKLYYTRISDILREYVDGRYGVRAMEMTSDEITSALVKHGIPEKSFTDLKTVMQVSDLVKFAKYTPGPETNDDCYYKSYYFVEETKPQEEIVVEANDLPDYED